MPKSSVVVAIRQKDPMNLNMELIWGVFKLFSVVGVVGLMVCCVLYYVLSFKSLLGVSK